MATAEMEGGPFQVNPEEVQFTILRPEELSQFVKEWWATGPFDNTNCEGFDRVYGPEKDTSIERTYRGKGDKEIKWIRVAALSEKTALAPAGYVDFNSAFQPNDWVVAYGLCYVYSPSKRKVTMLVGSDDGVKAWVNGEEVLSHHVHRGIRPDQDEVDVALKKGWSKILIKVDEGGGGWGFCLRFVDPKKELVFNTSPEFP